MFSTFAAVGLNKLIPALGLRDNCKENVSGSIARGSAAGCSSCMHSKGSMVCGNCAFGDDGKTVYVNEKNRYGEGEVLKKYTLLTYILFHFMNPDDLGFVSKIDPQEIAALLGCTERTVVNNISLLNEYGYINAGPDEIDGYYQLFINGYRNIYKPASSGGRGFLRIPFQFLKGLTCLPDINNIRLAIRALIFNSDQKAGSSLEKSYKKIKSFLPGYVTFQKLRDILESGSFKALFDVFSRNRSVTIVVAKEYNPSNAADAVRSECRKMVSDYIDSINKKTAGKGKKTLGNPIHFTENELKDIVNISLRFPVQAVVEGVKTFYETYIAVGLKYRNAGALVRTYASDYVTYGYIPT